MYFESASGKQLGGLLSPFHDDYTFIVYEFVEPELVQLVQPIYPVQVYVVQRHIRFVFGDHDEGWAPHVLVCTHSPEDPLRQGCLARTQVTGEQEDIARPRVSAENPAKLLCIFRACGLYLDWC